MDRLYLMEVYIAVAELESFAGAGRRLNISPPAVTRAVAALETRLGVKLLDRSTRNVRVTEVGLRYLDDAKRVLAEADEADAAAAGINRTPRGQLAITAPVLFGKLYVMPGIVDYLKYHPEVTISALFLDRVVNMIEEGMDIAVRIGQLPDSNLRAIPVGLVHRVLCASPDYIAEHGYPQQPQDLLQHRLILASGASARTEWQFGPKEKPQHVKLHPRLTVTSNDGAIEAARGGLGITRLMSYQVAGHLTRGELVRLLPHYEMPALPIHVVHQESRHSSAKVRSFIDLMVSRLRANQDLNPITATGAD